MKQKFSYLPFFIFSFIFFAAKTVSGQPVSQTFNASGTYVVPAGYTANVTIQAWGGGGSGGGGAAGNGDRSGGGGGAYSLLTTSLFAGSYAVTVGTGGVAPAASGAGQNGTASRFTTIVVAAGGTAGSNNNPGGAGGTVAASTGTVRFAGGAGGNRSNVGGGGGGGGSATTAANGGAGGAGVNNTGGAAGTGTGAGGAGGNNGAVSANGVIPGGGGGGKGNGGATSGNGARGRVIVTVNVVLAVHFGNLRAIEKPNGIQVEWTAFTEQDISKYIVERSADGNSFTSVGEIPARNLPAATNYSFTDINPLRGVNFYRIKSIDFNGNALISSILKVNLDKNNHGINIYPNPVTGGYLSFQSASLMKGDYSMRIINTMGQQVYAQHFMHTGGAISQYVQLPASIQPGIYTFRLDLEQVKVLSKTFIVQ